MGLPGELAPLPTTSSHFLARTQVQVCVCVQWSSVDGGRDGGAAVALVALLFYIAIFIRHHHHAAASAAVVVELT